MDTPVVMPQLGNEITEAQIGWLGAAGDTVNAGDPLLPITTPKLTMEIEAPVSGVRKQIPVPADELASVGALLAVIASA